MNNIKNFNEYFYNELESEVIKNELNEGVRSLINKAKSKRIKKELKDEIEMSKNIIDGIKTGLDSLSDDFGEIQKNLNKMDGASRDKGEKEKTLDAISKLLQQSRDSSWDLNELIDEGEIDYAGFTGNVALSAARYFGVLLFPFTSSIIIHKGYNYFFTLVKNTIRKALVMLQLNFDQFENLIITKSFQSMGYMEMQSKSEIASELMGKITTMMFDDKNGSMKGKKGWQNAKNAMETINKQIRTQIQLDKNSEQANNAYNCLDQYNNTYTKSLEVLRQYTQDDVQKQLDGIKSSITKLSGQDPDLAAFGELVIAAAEEHAFKVSSSIYNKFAKMTEVFSLPNQKKMIDLIQAADKEKQYALEKEASENKEKLDKLAKKEELDKIEDDGKELWTKLGGKVGKVEDYKYSDIKVGGECSFDKIFGDDSEHCKLSDDEKIRLMIWLSAHLEIAEKCDEDIKDMLEIFRDKTNDYIDAIIDDLGDSLKETDVEIDDNKEHRYIINFRGIIKSNVNENFHILNFDEYKLLKEGNSADKKDKGYRYNNFYSLFANEDEVDDKKIEYISKFMLKVLGSEKYLDNKEFGKRSDEIVDSIRDGLKSKTNTVKIGERLYKIIKDNIEKLSSVREGEKEKSED